MAAISVTSVIVLDNPSPFTNPLQFEIQYECSYEIEDDIEWKLIYVGSAEDEKYDQVLDSVLVGPITPGQYRFVFQADPPDHQRLPPDDIVGVTALLLTCSYKTKEFVRIGYYVNNDYIEEEMREDPPDDVQIDKLWRNILADKPRVTKFQIEWDKPVLPPTSGEVMDEGMAVGMGEEGMAVGMGEEGMDPMTHGMANGDYMTENSGFGGPVAVDMES